jgi:hypothetical protein
MLSIISAHDVLNILSIDIGLRVLLLINSLLDDNWLRGALLAACLHYD